MSLLEASGWPLLETGVDQKQSDPTMLFLLGNPAKIKAGIQSFILYASFHHLSCICTSGQQSEHSFIGCEQLDVPK